MGFGRDEPQLRVLFASDNGEDTAHAEVPHGGLMDLQDPDWVHPNPTEPCFVGTSSGRGTGDALKAHFHKQEHTMGRLRVKLLRRAVLMKSKHFA